MRTSALLQAVVWKGFVAFLPSKHVVAGSNPVNRSDWVWDAFWRETGTSHGLELGGVFVCLLGPLLCGQGCTLRGRWGTCRSPHILEHYQGTWLSSVQRLATEGLVHIAAYCNGAYLIVPCSDT